MKIRTTQLLDDLLERTERSSVSAQKLKTLSTADLNFKKEPNAWSVLECIEHLNLYGDFYLPEIEKRILSQKTTSTNTVFKSGLLGNYFANLMLVKDGKIKAMKMSTPKDKNPLNSALTITTIDRFLKQQERLKTLLVMAENIDLTQTTTSISLTKYIRLRLGDTFRFFVYHIERHILQAERARKV